MDPKIAHNEYCYKDGSLKNTHVFKNKRLFLSFAMFGKFHQIYEAFRKWRPLKTLEILSNVLVNDIFYYRRIFPRTQRMC